MVAPGLNYEFFESPNFRKRCEDHPELIIAVEAQVRKHFDQMDRFDADTRLGELIYQGQRFGFVVIRLGGSRLVLQQIGTPTWKRSIRRH